MAKRKVEGVTSEAEIAQRDERIAELVEAVQRLMPLMAKIDITFDDRLASLWDKTVDFAHAAIRKARQITTQRKDGTEHGEECKEEAEVQEESDDTPEAEREPA